MRSKLLLLTLAAGVTVLTLAVGHEALAKYEEPAYSVLEERDGFEIRQYPALIAAEVKVSGSGQPAENEAFRILAGYIFGKNVSKQKIAMTVPVSEQISSEKIAMTVPVTMASKQEFLTMRFFMPSRYTLSTLPEAIDKNIIFSHVPPSRFAVIKFSGSLSDNNMNSHTEQLLAFVATRGLKSVSDPIRAVYNAPWTLPFMRRNEIWIQLEA